jgi:hypothetical protein
LIELYRKIYRKNKKEKKRLAVKEKQRSSSRWSRVKSVQCIRHEQHLIKQTFQKNELKMRWYRKYFKRD